MKISERYGVEATTELLAANLDNENGNIDLSRKMKNEGEEHPCDQCGYIECVCAPDRSQDLS